MSNFNPTDEEILSFLMKDCSEELSRKMSDEMKNNSVLRKRIEMMTLIKSEIKSSFPFKKREVWRPLNLAWVFRQAIYASAIFTIGLVVESNFQVLSSKENIKIDSNLSVSKPLSWDDSKLASLM